ncbi:MAG: hypothetical protein INF91_06885 [Alphaproteobacteria bacterium]|nr:hypothetical protein [Alphaproteobacteria bacterium]
MTALAVPHAPVAEAWRRKAVVWLGVVGACGFLLPKVPLGGFEAGLTELMAVALAGLGLIVPVDRAALVEAVRSRLTELVYAIAFVLLAVVHGAFGSDPASIALAVRVFMFVLAGIILSTIDFNDARRGMMALSVIILAFYTPTMVSTVWRLGTGELGLAKFLWDYDAGRIVAPHESGRTSSVPLGYLMSILFLFFCLELRRKRSLVIAGLVIVSFTAVLLTASRAALLGGVATLMLYGLPSIWQASKPFVRFLTVLIGGSFSVAALAIVYAKTLIDGALDGSGQQRLDYYSNALTNVVSDPLRFMVGFGISDAQLNARTGIAFYESLLFNSLVQGGVIFAVLSFVMIASPLLLALGRGKSVDQRLAALALAATVGVGNLIGGANFFSVYAFFAYSLLHVYVRTR